MRLALRVLVAMATLCPACSHTTARARTYEVEVAHSKAPFQVGAAYDDGSGMSKHACSLWHTTYRWRDLNGDGKPRRPERMRVSTRCIKGPSSTPRTTPKVVDKTVKIEVESAVPRPTENSSRLDDFSMDGGGPNTAFYRGEDDARVELKNVTKIQFYDNIVIIRLRDGTGRLVPSSDFLGVAW